MVGIKAGYRRPEPVRVTSGGKLFYLLSLQPEGKKSVAFSYMMQARTNMLFYSA